MLHAPGALNSYQWHNWWLPFSKLLTIPKWLTIVNGQTQLNDMLFFTHRKFYSLNSHCALGKVSATARNLFPNLLGNAVYDCCLDKISSKLLSISVRYSLAFFIGCARMKHFSVSKQQELIPARVWHIPIIIDLKNYMKRSANYIKKNFGEDDWVTLSLIGSVQIRSTP